MREITYKPEYLTEQAVKILTQGRGYRDNTLFPAIQGLKRKKTDPTDVVLTEIFNCGKYEICDFFIIYYQSLLSRNDYRLLLQIVNEIRKNSYPEINSERCDAITRITGRITLDCDYCLWLCASPDDIYENYLHRYIKKANALNPGYADSCPNYHEKVKLNKEDYKRIYVSEILIPKRAVPLCDLGKDGMLIAFKN